MGVKDVFFLRFKDGELQNSYAVRKSIVEIIRTVMPDIIISPDPHPSFFDNFYRYHSDHRNVALAVFDSIYPAAGNKTFFTELGLKPHKIQKVYFSNPETVNLEIDITNFIDKKIKALSCHKSQIKDIESLGKRIKERSRKGRKFIENFRSMDLP